MERDTNAEGSSSSKGVWSKMMFRMSASCPETSLPLAPILALVLTALCCLFAFKFASNNADASLSRNQSHRSNIQSKNNKISKKSAKGLCCSCCSPSSSSSPCGLANFANGEKFDRAAPSGGASIMEQLVPEIRTHALSYLDYSSLCNLAMTNSCMRRAANDDNAWKALYRKDFTTEQNNVSPLNGWKSYYASTKAVMDVNAEYYRVLKTKSIADMSRLWLKADYVKCIHPHGLLMSGYEAVMESWERAFRHNDQLEFQLSDVRVRVVGDMAWVTSKEYLNAELFFTTNIYELHNEHWLMVHHHSTAAPDGVAFAF